MNCKPGDLAYVVGGIDNPPRNIGRVVEVISLEGTFDGLGPVWNVESNQPCATQKGFRNKFHMRDAWLRPISGVPVRDEVSEDLKEPA